MTKNPVPGIRFATKDDIPSMVNLRRELLEYERKVPLDDEDIIAIEQFYKETWDGSNPAYFVCASGKKLLGHVACTMFPAMPSAKNPSGLCAYVFDVSVTATERGKGIGRALMKKLLQYCKEQGVGYIALDATYLGEPLYRSLGFTEPKNIFLDLWKEQLDLIDLSG
ncbi:MAG TPA: GNAT family N-acetyltransferase [Candidatus Lokiarchaeia archaeon]|nr:GNAT family N-acetyltransferase [Candidatus Lokiarchaeia archaeon]